MPNVKIETNNFANKCRITIAMLLGIVMLLLALYGFNTNATISSVESTM